MIAHQKSSKELNEELAFLLREEYIIMNSAVMNPEVKRRKLIDLDTQIIKKSSEHINSLMDDLHKLIRGE